MSTQPLIQGSKEYVEIPVSGPDADLVLASALEVSVAPAGGTFSAWFPVATYVARVARFLVGPGTTVGTLPLGTVWFRLRITDSPEQPVLAAGALEVIA